MPHAALWVVQRNYMYIVIRIRTVSMPHAALWVVQPFSGLPTTISPMGFNAARGFVGGAARMVRPQSIGARGFNAARGFVGGAASSLSALVPLRGKSPFGKSPEI